MAVFEAVGNQFGYMGLGNVMHMNVFYACLCQHNGKDFCHIFGISVHGSISDHNSLFFWFISAPKIVFFYNKIQITSPDRTVERTDHLNVKR